MDITGRTKRKRKPQRDTRKADKKYTLRNCGIPMRQALDEEQCERMTGFLRFMLWAHNRLGKDFKIGKMIEAWNMISHGKKRKGRQDYKIDARLAWAKEHPQATSKEMSKEFGVNLKTAQSFMRTYGVGRKIKPVGRAGNAKNSMA